MTTATTNENMKTLQKCFLAIVIIGVLVFVMILRQKENRVRNENRDLRQQVHRLSNLVARVEAPKTAEAERSTQLGAPAFTTQTGEPSSKSSHSTDGIVRLYPRPPKVSIEQVDAFLAENQRNAASLLASSRITGEQSFLQEAMQKYSDDPQVAFAALFKADSSPEERRRWVDAFKQSAPENTLANYLSAHEYLKSGHVEQALQELNTAAGKRQFNDYFTDFSQDEEEAWSAAGYSTAEAKVFSSWSLGYPQLAELRELSRDMVTLANSYRNAGDESSAQAVLQMIVNLGQRLDELPSQPYPSRKTSLDIESIALHAMDPSSSYGGQSVGDRLETLSEKRIELDELEAQGDRSTLREKVTERDWITYKDRWRAFGEEAALRWLVGKYGEP